MLFTLQTTPHFQIPRRLCCSIAYKNKTENFIRYNILGKVIFIPIPPLSRFLNGKKHTTVRFAEIGEDQTGDLCQNIEISQISC